MNENKEIKISLTTFIVGIIAIVLLILVIAMGIYIATSNKKTAEPEIPPMSNVEKSTNNIISSNINNANNNTINTTTKEDEKTESLDVNSELVQKLYGYVSEIGNEYSTLDADQRQDFNSIIYVNGKSTLDTISNDAKLLIVIGQMMKMREYNIIKKETLPHSYFEGEIIADNRDFEPIDKSYWYNSETQKWEWRKFAWEDGTTVLSIYKDIETFDTDSIQKVAKEIFNEKIEIEKHSYNFLGECLIYDEGKYKHLYYEGGGGTAWDYRNDIIKAEKYNDEIIIYDNYVASWEEEDEKYRGEGTYYIDKFYTALDKKKEIKSSKKLEYMYEICSAERDENGNEIMKLDSQKAQEEYGITLPIYKHTFKQVENGNYYWVSTELTNY